MAMFNERSLSINTTRSSHSRRSSLSSVLLPLTPLSSSPSPPSAVDLLQAGAITPHDAVLFQPHLDVSFEIDNVVQIVIDSPIPNSRAPQMTEMRCKIADSERASYIRAAEMTPSMQSTLRKLSAEDLRAKYRVSRSDEPGTTGLFKLVKKSNDDAAVPVGRGRPVSLNLPKGQEGAFLGLKSSATPRSFLGFLTPKSAMRSAGNSRVASPLDPHFTIPIKIA